MRTECLTSRYYHNAPLRLEILMNDLGNKMQSCIQLYNRRPYGVGLVVAGYDDLGPHIYQVCPSANYYDCKAMAIGARSQSARTYLEKNFDEFLTSDLEKLVAHGLRALRDTLPNEVDLSNKVSYFSKLISAKSYFGTLFFLVLEFIYILPFTSSMH